MASNCDRCGKSVAGYTYCGGCVGDNTPMPKQAPPKCPWCDRPVEKVWMEFDYRPNMSISLKYIEEKGEYIEQQEIGDNTDWYWEAGCGHEVLDPSDFVGEEYVFDDSDYNPEDGYSERFMEWAKEVGIVPMKPKPHAGLLDDLKPRPSA